MPFDKVTIGGYPDGGLTTDRKPLMLADQAFSQLQNAYVWRYRVKKREGTVSLGRLQRNISAAPFFVTGVSPYTTNFLTQTGFISAANNANPGKITTFTPHNLVNGNQVYISGIVGAVGYNNAANNPFTITVVDAFNFTVGKNAAGYGAYVSGGFYFSNRRRFTTETYATIRPGSVVYTISSGTPRILTDDGNGNLVSNIAGSSGLINYNSGVVTITTDQAANTPTTLSYSYYPGLPAEGICKQDITTPGIDNTILFDTKYAYQFVGGAFQELVSSTPVVWTGSNTQPFWSANYQGADPSIRLFFETNNNINDPIRYYNNSTWADLVPIIADNPPSAAQSRLWQALIIVPYYGRLLALNTQEGLNASGRASASNFYARVRFSQIGDPTASDAWRSDIFGKGGFLDAPTNESIVSAAFYRNTLIVFFEYSTWQLRYIGEYGLPFIFERISSDFGSSSTYSSVIRDEGVDTISERGVIEASAGGVGRIDEKIPETAFSFDITSGTPNYVHGARDFEKELIYWNYLDTSNAATTQSFPNTTLVYNYINKTWAQFRDTITCFGPIQIQLGITWDSDTTFWDDSDVSWDTPDDQIETNYIASGNQQGFISIYENQNAEAIIPSVTIYAPSLFIFGIDPTVSPAKFTIPNHNLANGELIYIFDTLWSGTDPLMNDSIYSVTIVDANNVTLSKFNGSNYRSFNLNSSLNYIGGGLASLLPKINITGKDFNPYQSQGKQFKLSYIDFQMDANNEIPSINAFTVQLFVNSALNEQANLGGASELGVNSSIDSNFIFQIFQTNPCTVIVKNHSLTTGRLIRIANVLGMTQVNNKNFVITVVDANSFTLNGIDATGYGEYIPVSGIYNVYYRRGDTYQIGSQYAWYRFYSTQYGQYLRVSITYDDVLMNQVSTHQNSLELNAMNLFFRPGGVLIN